jgi:hypothetical protein
MFVPKDEGRNAVNAATTKQATGKVLIMVIRRRLSASLLLRLQFKSNDYSMASKSEPSDFSPLLSSRRANAAHELNGEVARISAFRSVPLASHLVILI